MNNTASSSDWQGADALVGSSVLSGVTFSGHNHYAIFLHSGDLVKFSDGRKRSVGVWVPIQSFLEDLH